ncbi:HAMP domain-containing protein [bacterium]|nr:HAMP domain-containing protein [bacterium]
MKRSIFARIFSSYFLVILLLGVLVLLFTLRTIRNHYIDTLADDLKNLGYAIQLKVMPLYLEGDFDALDSLVKQLGSSINTRITIVDTTGLVWADSEEDPAKMENHKSRPEISKALRGQTGRSMRFSETVKSDMLYIALPLMKNQRVAGVIRLSLFLEDIDRLIGKLRRRIIDISLIVILASMLIAALYARSLTKPIRKLADAARRVAEGDFDVKVILKKGDELNELADSFNFMTDKIKELFINLSHQKKELNSILASLQEGLLVTDESGKILLCNESCKRFAEGDMVQGKFYWEFLRNPKLTELVNQVIEKKKNVTVEVEFGEIVFLCNGTYVEPSREIVLVFHDITEMKNLENIKKDFVVNVSHELRTPLTAVKGFVETLESEVDQEHKRYLEIIKRHTDRLINIVQDLLLLSDLEEHSTKLEKEKLDMLHLIENVLKVFEPQIKEKDLKVGINSKDNIPRILGDPFKLEQMFINLIDNAIKYTQEGAINISLAPQEEDLKIEIEDSGIGIPHEHLNRIFERFYVVDKSRSRSVGGTGLGLSIVKHIVLLHNGEISVESILGKGTKFTIILPIGGEGK